MRLMPTGEKTKIRGFTLIELLIVIAIIGILATMALLITDIGPKRARDTRRKSDLRQYSAALVDYASKNTGYYPAHASSVSPAGSMCTTELLLTNCPTDPKTPTYSYSYISNSGSGPTATSYVMWATYEAQANTYWVLCSSGSNGTISTANFASSGGGGGGICPSPLVP